MVATDTKACTMCGVQQPLEGYHRMSQASDGRRPSCKSCTRSKQRDYQSTRSAENRSRCSRHYEANRAERLARQRERDDNHREEISARRTAPEGRIRNADRQQVREANKKQVTDEYVDRKTVFERDGGTCGICHKEASVEGFHIDHVIPLSKGGRHNYNNVQVAHPICNSIKGARLDFVPSGT